MLPCPDYLNIVIFADLNILRDIQNFLASIFLRHAWVCAKTLSAQTYGSNSTYRYTQERVNLLVNFVFVVYHCFAALCLSPQRSVFIVSGKTYISFGRLQRILDRNKEARSILCSQQSCQCQADRQAHPYPESETHHHSASRAQDLLFP